MSRQKPIAIESIDFEEESLPSGRKLLHFIFKQKFGSFHYRWTPPWKGGFGVERLFFKALEIEEWNDYDGVWSKELRRATKEIPSLEGIGLPVRIAVGELMGPIKYDFVEDRYRVAIEVLTDEKRVYRDVPRPLEQGEQYICIDDLKIPWASLAAFLREVPSVRGVSKGTETVTKWVGDEPDGMGTFVRGDWENVGVRFWVWIEAGTDKAGYRTVGRELAASIRTFLRKRLSDHQSLQGGFEDV